jgi:hypothetical protein
MKTVTRMVPVERDGKQHLVPQEFQVPRDYDAMALTAVLTAASLAVAGAITWSTVAIGGLLSGVAPVWAAYLVAGVFDLAWIVCLILEWLCRFDRARAALPVACGWVALALSVCLITLHGASNGGTALMAGTVDWSGRGTVLGACGGAVSVIAKGMATVVMRHTSVAMDPASEAWLSAERAEVNATLAVTAARRQLTRTQSRIATETLALSAPVPAEQDNPRTVPVLSQDTGQDSPADRTGHRDRTAVQDRTALPRTVRDTPADRLSELSGRQLPRAFVRGLLSADPSLSNAELSSAVRSEYGQDMKADNIAKTIQRARGDLSQAV